MDEEAYRALLQASDGADSTASMGERRHELLAEVFDLVDHCLCATGYSPTLAALAAGEVADMLADHWGEQTIRFPKDARRKFSERELVVYERYDGRNLGELARAYGTYKDILL